jgi:hypothetical protein
VSGNERTLPVARCGLPPVPCARTWLKAAADFLGLLPTAYAS